MKGFLNLSHTKIDKLPNNLKVESYLDITNTSIETIPEHLYVAFNLYFTDTPLFLKYSRSKIEDMLLDKKGYVRTLLKF